MASDSKESNRTILGSLVWKICERGATQLVSLIVQIILARILAPEAFGVIAILLVFINIANVFIQKGFASSLIRKKEATDIDFNTAFLVSECIALTCVAIIWIISPLLESWYQTNGLGFYLRVLSLVLVFGALNSIQNAVLVRKMEFKKIFIRSFLSAVSSGVISIAAAMANLGIWVLIIQSISQNMLLCIITTFQCPWKPKLQFSKSSFNEIFSFGSKILVAELISIGVEDTRTLIIGKKYSTSDLAYYDRGQVYPATAMRSIYDALMSVMLPVFSKNQDQDNVLARQIEKVCVMSCFFTSPLFIGFAAVAKPFVLLLLTEKWIDSTVFIVVFCFYQLIFPIYGIMRQGLYAIGKSDIVLKLEILKAALFLISIIIGVQLSPLGVAIATSIAIYIVTIVYIFVLRRFVGINVKSISSELIKTLASCLIMYLIITFFNNIVELGPALTLLIDILMGGLVFVGVSVLLRNQSMQDVLRRLKTINTFKKGA